MALIRFTLDNKQIGFVRNNKAGSTTVLNYIGHIFWNEPPHKPTGTRITSHLGEDSYYGQEKSFDYYKDKLLKCDVRIAVYRDPVKKLLSGFTHAKKFNKIHFLDDFLLKSYLVYVVCNILCCMLFSIFLFFRIFYFLRFFFPHT